MNKVNLKDIAKHLGISIATVSYVLNGQEKERRVSSATAEKVREAIHQFEYTANQIAKSLKTKKTNTIGIIVADINYRFTTHVVRAIEKECQLYGYTVIFGSSYENPETFLTILNVLINKQVDGLIVIPVDNDRGYIEQLKSREIPFVIVDRVPEGSDLSIVSIDNKDLAYQCTQHLVKTGHQRVAFMSYQTGLSHLLDRKAGYVTALQDADIEIDQNLIIEIDEKNFVRGVQSGIDALLERGKSCDGIFFTTDTIAVEAIKYLNQKGIRVPDQVGIVSFDESDAFPLFHVPVTHGRQPLRQIGEVAVKMLLELIDENTPKGNTILKSTFIVGKSCGEK
ncbi:transcriptional regulator, LacI family [Mucilaginibacter pineti]|uniref:Transcriptional regulator, LacI family n=1 Tax=Mucilaginibacter pineti TaxID=1391627 RepID=A0A1G7M4N0_9SPHI|nr:substrate-binding domain-containing protein [Mucilaginibacter pineti]SDF56109.1 transcriptional regulator, LacI family [Mucilaginibacter pineti]